MIENSQNITSSIIQTSQKTRKTLKELMEEEKLMFENFYYLILYTNPLKDQVKLFIDDGNTKMIMKRDKFINLLKEILDLSQIEYKTVFYKFKEAILSYGKYYFYDRTKNEFRELYESIDYEHIRPQDLVNETRKSLIQEKRNNYFNEINKRWENDVKNIKIPFHIKQNTIFQTVRQLTKT